MDNFWTWMQNGTPVVTTPDCVDISNDDVLRRKLLAAGAWSPVVVVDGSTCRTLFAVRGMRVLDEVGRMMADAGGELRLVIGRPNTPYCLEIVGYDKHVRVFRSLTEALSAPRQGWKSRPQAA